jgi:hypothetical protein
MLIGQDAPDGRRGDLYPAELRAHVNRTSHFEDDSPEE